MINITTENSALKVGEIVTVAYRPRTLMEKIRAFLGMKQPKIRTYIITATSGSTATGE